MRDLVSNLKSVVAIGAASLAADTTPGALDLQGYHSAMLQIAVGAGGITFDATNKIEFKLTHSDDNSTYTAVADADVKMGQNADASVGSGGIVKSLIAAHASADITEVGYVGGKRYLKLQADFSGTHGTGTPLAANLVLGHPFMSPA